MYLCSQELSLRIEHLTEEAQKKRHLLDQETTETLTGQVCIWARTRARD